jgi:hypothetical protein
MTDAKPLQDLDLKPGDVVECVKNEASWTKGKRYTVGQFRGLPSCCDDTGLLAFSTMSTFRIVSRVDDEWGPWALGLHHIKGARIETHILPGGQTAYRVKREPVVTKAVAYCSAGSTITPLRSLGDTHLVTVTYRDGADPVATVEKL